MNRAAIAILALYGCALAAGQASGTFADSAGFSGRNGFTCVSCHQPPSPTNDALAHLDGLPTAWDLGVSYDLTIRVTGGPPGMPAPQPQGGFDLAVSSGRLSGDPQLLRTPSHDEITYRPAGTMQREWHVTWQAPNLAVQPTAIHFWLAVLAANGNHVVATNTSDSGETLDAAAALQVDVPPSAATVAAWQGLPLRAPSATPLLQATWIVDGEQRDLNATGIGLRLDGGSWISRDAGSQWRVLIPDSASHVLEVRSEGAGRESPVVTLHMALPSAATDHTPDGAAHTSPAVGPAFSLVALLGATRLLAIRRPRP